jgi:hypothetical protein
MYNNNRTAPRVNISLPIHLSFGSQITLKGQIKDISLESIFVLVKSSVPMTLHDELEFQIDPGNQEAGISGKARISRVAPGEGIAIYFIQMDDASLTKLKKLVGTK